MYDYVRTLQQRVRNLEAELAEARTERDLALIDRQCAITELAHAYRLAHHPGDMPAALVHALRSASAGPWQRVQLTIGDQHLHALVDGGAGEADPAAEGAVWTWLTGHAAEPPEHPFERAEMPARLYGVAWPGGQVTVAAALSGRDVVDARRALRPRRRSCGIARALGLVTVPAIAAGRAAADLARDAQAAVSASMSAAAASATAALPVVTAAAISCSAAASCAPAISMDSWPPAERQVVERAVPAALVVDPPRAPVREAPEPPDPGEEAAQEHVAEAAPSPAPEPTAEPSPGAGAVPPAAPVTDAQPEAPPAPSTAPRPGAPVGEDGGAVGAEPAVPSPAPVPDEPAAPAPVDDRAPDPAPAPPPDDPAPGATVNSPADGEPGPGSPQAPVLCPSNDPAPEPALPAPAAEPLLAAPAPEA